MYLFVISLPLFLGVVNAASPCYMGMWRTDQNDCSSFEMCVYGRLIKFKCPEKTVINSEMRACVPVGSKMDECTTKQSSYTKQKPNSYLKPQLQTFTHPTPPKLIYHSPKPTQKVHIEPPISNSVSHLHVLMCKNNPTALLPHPGNCAKHIDCSRVLHRMTGVFECPYPMLWNEDSKHCAHSAVTKCGKRFEPKDPCEYDKFQCDHSSHCVPCHIRYPSCKGKPNGLNAWSGRENTPYFVVCNNERLVHQSQCSYDEMTKVVFDAEKRKCVRAAS